jgi:hypothetical protein
VVGVVVDVAVGVGSGSVADISWDRSSTRVWVVVAAQR